MYIMDLNTLFETLVTAIESVYGITPVRLLPLNLRVEMSPPATALGWQASLPSSATTFSDNDFLPSFQFAYFAANEKGILDAVTKLEELSDAIPQEMQVSSIARVSNATESKSLDYVFTASISLQED